ncbi:(R,R)-butanediol dehydrogenase/meso-butanediol dehydrogenase/diacetyl reductase [Halarchaeum rubridurum]|uniref:(R,R)-butanediol dehydrogenase n=1 Tax=Halarchaeum rubridurum TaxID=489911 RepID=A0A830FU85_9EURY|nr:2,3-butanediol dehydrogenase [Halarchaeum rubridurum]MBP1954869.1 (R,R)-butanediol dehydrogenase/meso-butanediol dehydrogenase/diacetyl reductase [Halarchaeum rubridurum]GGM60378.1 (R,R)-butanediol dehydrogenase [Halarchaeum rubridurum]
MRAAVYHGREDVRVEEIEEPTVGDGDVLVDVAACGICGSDLHEYAAGPITVPDAEPHPVTGERAPLPMGHEFGGRVAAVGSDVTDVAVGDTVAVNPVLYCGDCRYCTGGNYHLCESLGFVGLSGNGGGFAEQVAVPREKVVAFPDSVPAEHAALVEPFSVGLHAVRNADFEAGDDVAVFGAGPIGLTVVQAAVAAGARTVYAVEPQETRRDLAGEVGADVTLDPSAMDALDALLNATDGGVDATFEVAGIEATVRDAIAAAKHDGSVTVVSLFEEDVALDPNEIVLGERSVGGSAAYEAGPRGGVEFDAVPDMFADGTLDPEPLVSDRIALDDVVAAGFEALLDPERDAVKVLVEP